MTKENRKKLYESNPKRFAAYASEFKNEKKEPKSKSELVSNAYIGKTKVKGEK